MPEHYDLTLLDPDNKLGRDVAIMRAEIEELHAKLARMPAVIARVALGIIFSTAVITTLFQLVAYRALILRVQPLCVRRRRRGSEYAAADGLRSASKGSIGDEGLQPITTALPTSGSIGGMPDEVTLRALDQPDQIRTDPTNLVIGLEVI
jgi:hypothetical protein